MRNIRFRAVAARRRICGHPDQAGRPLIARAPQPDADTIRGMTDGDTEVARIDMFQIYWEAQHSSTNDPHHLIPSDFTAKLLYSHRVMELTLWDEILPTLQLRWASSPALCVMHQFCLGAECVQV